MFKFWKKIEKPVKRDKQKRELRKVEIEDSMVNETWTAFHSIGVPVAYFEYVEESDGAGGVADRIMYRVTLDATQDEWDQLNRKLGALGLTKAPEK